MLAEDDRARNQAYAEALRSAGFRVTQTHNGLDAWKAVLARPPHLVVTDVSLPGMDGVELCRRLRSIEKTASLPAITVTGLTDREHSAAAAAAGFDSLLLMPCAPTDLLSEICRALERSAEERARAGALRMKSAVLRTRSSKGANEAAGVVGLDAPQDEALQRIKADFREMPGLWVTSRQGARLWNVSHELCVALLESLVDAGYLARSGQHYRLP
ncbi:MAG TPA: response regulator [Vicinamibacterales bacterium]|nr:response regulator [Vicinamibacterales bacterium]